MCRGCLSLEQHWESHGIAGASRGGWIWGSSMSRRQGQNWILGISMSRLLKLEMRARRARMGLIYCRFSKQCRGCQMSGEWEEVQAEFWGEAGGSSGMRLRRFWDEAEEVLG